MKTNRIAGALAALAVTTVLGCNPEPVSPINDTTVVSRVTLPADSFTVRVGATIEIVASAFDQRGLQLTRLPDGGKRDLGCDRREVFFKQNPPR